MWRSIEGFFTYNNDVDFYYKATYRPEDRGDYFTAPVPFDIQINFIGIETKINLIEYLTEDVFDAVEQDVIEQYA